MPPLAPLECRLPRSANPRLVVVQDLKHCNSLGLHWPAMHVQHWERRVLVATIDLADTANRIGVTRVQAGNRNLLAVARLALQDDVFAFGHTRKPTTPTAAFSRVVALSETPVDRLC